MTCEDCKQRPATGRARLTVVGDAFPEHTGRSLVRWLCRYCRRARRQLSYLQVEDA